MSVRWLGVVVACVFLFIAESTVQCGVSNRRGRHLRSPFDYSTYYKETYKPERTRSLTPKGISLRQSTNPPAIVDQIRGTGFEDVQCDILSRTWTVTFSSALEESVFGEVLLTPIGECYVSNSGVPRFALQPITDSENVTIDIDTGHVTTVVKFVLDTPNVKQNVLACTFELFIASVDDPLSVVTPRLISVLSHLCDRSDGLKCKFWELGCLIDSGDYKGAAIFWDVIYVIEIVVLTLIGMAVFGSDIAQKSQLQTEISGYLYGQVSIQNSQKTTSEETLEGMTDRELVTKLDKIRLGRAQMQVRTEQNPGFLSEDSVAQQSVAQGGNSKPSGSFQDMLSAGRKDVSYGRRGRRTTQEDGLLSADIGGIHMRGRGRDVGEIEMEDF